MNINPQHSATLSTYFSVFYQNNCHLYSNLSNMSHGVEKPKKVNQEYLGDVHIQEVVHQIVLQEQAVGQNDQQVDILMVDIQVLDDILTVLDRRHHGTIVLQSRKQLMGDSHFVGDSLKGQIGKTEKMDMIVEVDSQGKGQGHNQGKVHVLGSSQLELPVLHNLPVAHKLQEGNLKEDMLHELADTLPHNPHLRIGLPFEFSATQNPNQNCMKSVS